MARPRSDIAPRIVRAARKRFLLDGVDGASLRRIAADAKTNLGMVYYYFKSKDKLFLAVVEDVYAGLSRDLSELLEPAESFDEGIARAYARIAQMSDEEFTVMRLVLREAMVSSQRLGRVLRRFEQGHIGLVFKLFLSATIEGRVRDDLPPAAVLPCLAGLALGVLLARRMAEAASEGKAVPPFGPPDAAAVGRAAAAILSRGLAPKSQP